MPSLDLLLLLLYLLFSIAIVSIIPPPHKWKGLLSSSLLFYYFLAGDKIIFLLLFSFTIYCLGFLIKRYPAKTWLFISLALAPLILIKVITPDFHFRHLTSVKNNYLSETNSSIIQVLGISYFTFNGISYLIDIKRKYIQPEKNFLLVLIYLIYFPCILSGPLHRAKYLFSQFRQISITDSSISSGLRLILIGLFKNIVVGKRLSALLQNLVSTEISGPCYLIAGLLFFFYLYFNFSSFIDIFQGISKIFNINLKDNFRNRIYLSFSRQHFWQGWHITLNEWFRDYFFFNLAKQDRKRRYTNAILLITFLLIALWHEVSQIFLIWGLMNASWIIIEKKVNLEALPYPGVRRKLGVVYHLMLASVLALVFVSPDLTSLIHRVFLSPGNFPDYFFRNNLNNIAIIIGAFLLVDYHYSKAGTIKFDEYVGSKPLISRWFIYTQLALLIIAFGITNGVDNYYVQF
ncbi:hypothetical protein KHS38_00735 [Mucilaginibacter sp. Bleaf8]|uniref:MBOAT family O-acyltransferase n=1 Tax=Mucilaginibacter sp. Bleaf8 TaxID=2834430 RepID=UPI001BCE0379|nr:MBOAT family O-acyltransferase [Mucilaginibacter sp. Bleaf8]MBS7562913.1 hypothetical protein [Mucilaginibacter sp. Bleaf8]